MRQGQKMIHTGANGAGREQVTIVRTGHTATEGTPFVEITTTDGGTRTVSPDHLVYWTKHNPNGSLFDPEVVGVY